MNPADRALAIAARIADGSAIDWPDPEASPAGPVDAAIIEELKAIAALATLHRAPSDWLSSEATPAGTQWGPLTILAPVAEGRFGQVYRAWDVRLQRQVALKLLHAPSSVMSGSPTHAIEEARLLARVRHPNVLTVYGAECLDGQVGIWTEFIEGRTLEDLLAERGTLPSDEVVAIGVDLCRALAAVHDAGLLHRDVKSQNVMRETGGRIVLMDFGTGHDVELLPASAGDLSGTPLYLAPELFAGGRPTVASDIYALAVLLFHLLTGDYPVPGRTMDDVRAGHRDKSVIRLRSARPDLPATLVEAIEHGLASDPSQRFESTGAFEAALCRMQASPVKGARTNPIRLPTWATVGVGLAATGLVAWLWDSVPASRLSGVGPPASVTNPGQAATPSTPAQPEALPPVGSEASRKAIPNDGAPDAAPPTVHRRLEPPPTLTSWPGHPSSDGRYWPYVNPGTSGNDLWIWEPSTGGKRLVTTTATDLNAQESAMSPDGRRVVFTSLRDGGYELLVARADGSERQRILPRGVADRPEPIEWSRNGKNVLCWLLHKNGQADLALVPSSGGAAMILKVFETRRPRTVRLSPNERFVVYDFRLDPASGQDDVFIMATTPRSRPRELIGGATNDFGPVWAPDGSRVFFLSNRSGPTEGWTLEVADGVAVGTPVRVAQDLEDASPIALTDNGAYYYKKSTSSTGVYTLRLDLTGVAPPTEPVRVQPASVLRRVGPSWSPDGKFLSHISGSRPEKTVSVQDMVSGEVRDLRLSPPLTDVLNATRWSPDGSAILIRAADVKNRWGYFAVDVRTGAVTPALLFETPGNDQAYGFFQWSNDSKWVLFRHLPRGIVRRELETGKEDIVVDMKADRLTHIFGFALSPDGHSLAYCGFHGEEPIIMVKTDTDPPHVVRRFPPGAEAVICQTWTPDGQEILFTKAPTGRQNVVQNPDELWAIGAASGDLRDTLVRIPANTRTFPVALSGDGRLAYTLGEQLAELWVLEHFLPKPRAGK